MNQRAECHHITATLLLVLSVVMGATGCGGKKGASTMTAAATAGESAGQRGNGAGTVQPGPPVTDADCRQFADAMKRALSAHDAASVGALIDMDALAARATDGLDISERAKKGFISGLNQSMTQSTGIAQQLVNSVSQGGSCDLLRIVEVEGRKRARMRLIMANTGVGYIDFLPGRNASGQILAQDMYLFFSGELMSQTIRRPAISMVASENRSILQRLSGAESAYLTWGEKIKSMMVTFNSGQPAEAMRIYTSLPDSIKQDKSFKLIQVRIAQKLGDTEYARAISELQAAFPNDASVALISIDGYILQKQYDRALKAIDHLDQSVGGDSYLNKVRAGVYMLSNQPEKARQMLQKYELQMPEDKTTH